MLGPCDEPQRGGCCEGLSIFILSWSSPCLWGRWRSDPASPRPPGVPWLGFRSLKVRCKPRLVSAFVRGIPGPEQIKPQEEGGFLGSTVGIWVHSLALS